MFHMIINLLLIWPMRSIFELEMKYLRPQCFQFISIFVRFSIPFFVLSPVSTFLFHIIRHFLPLFDTISQISSFLLYNFDMFSSIFGPTKWAKLSVFSALTADESILDVHFSAIWSFGLLMQKSPTNQRILDGLQIMKNVCWKFCS